MIDKLEKHKCINDAHMKIQERGFAIGTLHAGQWLRHMRVTLNQPIYVQASFEQAHYVYVSNKLVLGVTPSF